MSDAQIDSSAIMTEKYDLWGIDDLFNIDDIEKKLQNAWSPDEIDDEARKLNTTYARLSVALHTTHQDGGIRVKDCFHSTIHTVMSSELRRCQTRYLDTVWTIRRRELLASMYGFWLSLEQHLDTYCHNYDALINDHPPHSWRYAGSKYSLLTA